MKKKYIKPEEIEFIELEDPEIMAGSHLICDCFAHRRGIITIDVE